jgi:chitinase
VKDENVVGPYMYKNNLWIGYDDVEAIRFKSEWIKSMGLGGAMFWSVETDDFHGKCGEPNELIKTAYRSLIGNVPVEPTTTRDPSAPSTTEAPPQPTPPPDGKCTVNGEFLGELCDPGFTICSWNGESWDQFYHPCAASQDLYYDPAIKQW